MKGDRPLLGTALGSMRVAAGCVLVLAFAAIAASCGSSGGRSSPTPPQAIIDTPSQLVDVGERAVLDASNSVDPEGDGLLFFWTLLTPLNSDAAFEDHCEGDSVADGANEVCTSNDDSTCAEDPDTLCATNADCPSGDFCNQATGSTSSQCPDGARCEVGESRTMDYATFTPDVGGSYTVRVLAESSRATDTETLVIETNPTLYVVGSLFGFGGTLGGLIGPSADAEEFATNARTGIGSPVDGRILLAVPTPPLVREFRASDASIVGTFGETGGFSEVPAALAFDDRDNLNVAYEDGVVRVFDGGNGLFVSVFGDVATGGESVTAMAFSPVSGNLLVVDGAAGAGIREYAPDGASLGILGETATAAVTQASDLVFQGVPALDLLIADAGGRVVRCDPDGTACADFGVTATFLAGSIPTGIDVNPALSPEPEGVVLITDGLGRRVVGCSEDGSACSDFGETAGLNSTYSDLLFAPPASPTTTTITTLPPGTTTTTLP